MKRTLQLIIGTGVAAGWLAGPALGQALVKNPSFESNWNEA